jgi:hypothetical protein
MTLWSRYQTCLKGTACLTLLGSGGADADKAAVEVLDALAGKYRNDKLNFAQVDGTVQTGFAEALGGKDAAGAGGHQGQARQEDEVSASVTP